MDLKAAIEFVPFLTDAYDTVAAAGVYHLVVDGLLILSVIFLLFRKSYQPSEVNQLSEKEKDELIAEWQPDELVPDTPADHPALNARYINGKLGTYVDLDGQRCTNFASMNFLGFVGEERIENVAVNTISTYGVGSCGPRGFYGTVDVHLQLEKEFAEFMHCEEAVLYSYGFAAIASAIPAYAKRGDVIFCDKGVNFAIQKGLVASRSKVEFFEHNSVEDLERLLRLQAEKDKQNPKKAKVTRRFLVVEGIYLNSGQICPLPQLMELKWKYKVRIFIDESQSFGVLGKSGRGVTEHFGIDVTDIDMICASLENAIGSTGGFCCGRSFVVDHQRLSGLGYCFSAALPPLLAAAAIEGLHIMQEEPDRFTRLRRNCRTMFQRLHTLRHFNVEGSDVSPIFHLRLKQHGNRAEQEAKLSAVVEAALKHGILLAQARYLVKEEIFLPEPSIRVAVNSELLLDDLEKCVKVLDEAATNVL